MSSKQDDRHYHTNLTPEAAVDRLEELYDRASTALVRALDRYLETRMPPTAKSAPNSVTRFFASSTTAWTQRRARGGHTPNSNGPGSMRRRSPTRGTFGTTCWSSC